MVSSTSSGPLRRADVDYLVRNAMISGYQLFSLLTPPIYLAILYARHPSFSVNRLLRATWIGGLVGAAGAGSIAYLRHIKSSEDFVRVKRMEAAYNTDRVRRNDHATIGSVLLSVLTPALLWKRASTLNLILGGAGLGSAIGVAAHYARSFSGSPPPKVTPVIQVIGNSQT
ncbi:hypothetical protein BDQ17DRAFT_1357779 [Cyathus striatus]|nr:hypothetical protein BDQ17DRAFT_1357779 [Cyathus striatus]